jgi:hypothetical protein
MNVEDVVTWFPPLCESSKWSNIEMKMIDEMNIIPIIFLFEFFHLSLVIIDII